jgi:nicotinamide-nucleotide amidase
VKAASQPAMPEPVAGNKVGSRTDFRLEADVLRRLARRKQTLALAESCTGGCLAHRLTNVPGASTVFLGGVVAYSNAAKQKFLGVRMKTLTARGAVSEAVAREMAEGARRKFGADFALGITGIAGPGGGTKARPVGTVFIALAGAFGSLVEHRLNAYERKRFKDVTARQALALLQLRLSKSGTLCACE